MNKKLAVVSLAVILSIIVTIPVLGSITDSDNIGKNSTLLNQQNWKSEWENVKKDYEQLSITPGRDENHVNFGWYSRTADQAKVRISSTKDMETSITFHGTSSQYKRMDGILYYSNKVTASFPKTDTEFYYQYYLNGNWSNATAYKNRSKKEFDMLFVGDPQIGASIGRKANGSSSPLTGEEAARNDSFQWKETLEDAISKYPDIRFVLSAGDQINEMVKKDTPEQDLQQEMEYAGFLAPKLLDSLPVATTIGNHDSFSANYQNHFNNPNSYIDAATPSTAGYDYYFTYNAALFIFLDGNNATVKNHQEILKKATKENPDAIWRIVTIHQDIYGYGGGHANSDGMVLRTQLTPLFDTYDIDVVLQGHDHTYMRSYPLTGDGRKHQAYDYSVDLKDPSSYRKFLEDNQCYKLVGKQKNKKALSQNKSKGTIYVEGGSSTGSKLYASNGTEPIYVAYNNKILNPTYSIIHISPTSFKIKTYDVVTDDCIDQYAIQKGNAIEDELNKEEKAWIKKVFSELTDYLGHIVK